MKLVGTSITAVEIARISFAIDYLATRIEVDPTRIGMVGLSYGGYYAQVTQLSILASKSLSQAAIRSSRRSLRS